MLSSSRFVPSRTASAVFALAVLTSALLAAVPGAVDDAPPQAGDIQAVHRGPAVERGAAGPMRVVPALYAAFDEERAMESVRFADRFYRAPRDDGYEATLDHILGRLRAAGFGSDERFELRVIETVVDQPAWTAVGAKIALLLPNGTSETLHVFDAEHDRDRTILPVGAPPCRIEGEAVFHLEEVIHGKILVTQAPTSAQLLQRARMRGAVAVVSSSLGSFNVDPSGAERHLDAIQYRRFKADPGIAVFQISPRTYQALHGRAERGESTDLLLEAEVRRDDRPLRTIVAAVVGESLPDEAVPIVSHVQEPGANDNASGLSGLLESAVSYVALVRDGTLTRPQRTVVFIWGDEFLQSESWLANTHRRPVAMISSDMTGQSRRKTGAIALLERMPDPGALIPLDPDVHTPWGAGEVDPDSLRPNGFAILGRCALSDVADVDGSGWQTADHPWEGGSDHDTFIASGVPACLFWHFTDFTYHTSLDRIEYVDPSEMHRTAVAILATALAVADPRAEDVARYHASVEHERALRVAAAKAVGDEALARLWTEWCDGARGWLGELCATTEGAPR